jgi:hypothetical protein
MLCKCGSGRLVELLKLPAVPTPFATGSYVAIVLLASASLLNVGVQESPLNIFRQRDNPGHSNLSRVKSEQKKHPEE